MQDNKKCTYILYKMVYFLGAGYKIVSRQVSLDMLVL